MQETLIIFMRDETGNNHPDWLVIKSNGEIGEQTLQGDVTQLASAADNRDVWVIVPAHDVLLTTVNLPQMSRARLMQALPYALEDQLVNDVESLHIVTGESGSRTALSVAIVAKSKMESWLALLKEWRIKANVMMPVTFVLPFLENHWHLFVDNNCFVARTGSMHGFAGDATALQDWLTLALQETTDKPQFIHLWQCENNSLPACDIPMEAKIISREEILMSMAQQALHMPPMNLLQGNYQGKKVRYPQKRKLLKIAMGLTFAFMCLLVSYPLVSLFLLQQRTNEINAEIRNIYFRHFPHATRMVAPRLRMEDRLKTASADKSANPFFLQLLAVSNAMKAEPHVMLKRLNFQHDQLALEVTATSSENFARFGEVLSQQGWRVQQQNANLAGETVQATMLIRRASS